MEETKTFDQWGILEVMGHQRFAGRITEQTIAGAAFIRVDVPEVDGKPAFTKIIGAGAIFAITPTTEEAARTAADRFRSRAFDQFYLTPVALPAPEPTAVGSSGGFDPYEDEDFDDVEDG